MNQLDLNRDLRMYLGEGLRGRSPPRRAKKRAKSCAPRQIDSRRSKLPPPICQVMELNRCFWQAATADRRVKNKRCSCVLVRHLKALG